MPVIMIDNEIHKIMKVQAINNNKKIHELYEEIIMKWIKENVGIDLE